MDNSRQPHEQTEDDINEQVRLALILLQVHRQWRQEESDDDVQNGVFAHGESIAVL